MKIKTSELTGPALDWAVAKAEGWEMNHHAEGGWFLSNDVETMPDETLPEYSTEWAEGGPIIERERITIEWLRWDDKDSALGVWGAQKLEKVRTYREGFSPLIAAMRCFVASALGDEVDIPEGISNGN